MYVDSVICFEKAQSLTDQVCLTAERDIPRRVQSKVIDVICDSGGIFNGKTVLDPTQTNKFQRMYMERWCGDARKKTGAHDVSEEATATSELAIRRLDTMMIWNLSKEEVGKEFSPNKVFERHTRISLVSLESSTWHHRPRERVQKQLENGRYQLVTL